MELDDDEKAELKRKFRKASMLCHPDKFTNETSITQKQSEDIFKELNEANAKNDLSRVKEILEDLKKGTLSASRGESISDKGILQVTLERLKVRLDQLEFQIIRIKKSETYQTVDSIDDWDTYFEQIKENLELELEELTASED